MATTQTTQLQDIRDARRELAAELSLLDSILRADRPTSSLTRQAIAKQTQKVEDAANTLKHVAKRFEEGI